MAMLVFRAETGCCDISLKLIESRKRKYPDAASTGLRHVASSKVHVLRLPSYLGFAATPRGRPTSVIRVAPFLFPPPRLCWSRYWLDL